MRQPLTVPWVEHDAPGAVRRGRLPVWVLGSAAALFAVAGCSTHDAVCGGGECPVLTVGATGRACVDNGQQPPKGYSRFPEGKVPQHVDDQWDRYWRSHTLDKHGRIIDASQS
ncbi:SCO0607 family lipoprotein [Streptomyces sp. NPDC001691]|uniref:SCO0607 family lipoprotein n=1 Tax=Streptomyces sp. NPDC001691 TaxID=3364600 RepID=UPI0036950F00